VTLLVGLLINPTAMPFSEQSDYQLISTFDKNAVFINERFVERN
jgi:maltodextrin utilization protein YvdJ